MHEEELRDAAMLAGSKAMFVQLREFDLCSRHTQSSCRIPGASDEHAETREPVNDLPTTPNLIRPLLLCSYFSTFATIRQLFCHKDLTFIVCMCMKRVSLYSLTFWNKNVFCLSQVHMLLLVCMCEWLVYVCLCA